MSGNSPPQYTTSQSETPLDLTVKRTEFDHSGILNTVSYTQSMDRHPHMTSPVTSHLDYQGNLYPQYEQYEHRTNYQSTGSPLTPPPSLSHLKPPPSPPVNESRSGAPSPTPYSTQSYYESNRSYLEPSSFEGCALPKKRKNLWRPYDSRMALGEIDSDSSDSTSGGSSDQEFKTPQMDPVKKRKMNMIQYMANENNTENQSEDDKTAADQPLDNESSQAGSNQSSPSKSGEAWNNMSQNTETAHGYFTNMAEELTKSQLSLFNSYPETRDKMLSGMKKRDIFGWGLKLMKPSEDGSQDQTQLKTSPVSSSPENHPVCQDGEKTYIELQTVRTGNSPPATMNETTTAPPEVAEQSPFKIPKSAVKGEVGKPNMSPAKVQRKKDTFDKEAVNAIENEKENVNNGTVFIQTRDNVIKSYDETKNVPVKTRKSISLIDLVEEIESTAKHLEIEDEKTRETKNKRVAALLKQCNHVKLQALDYLMANVLIQDREPHYTRKNEKVQKMLKGDKITSVNMLDVLELQVECGLN